MKKSNLFSLITNKFTLLFIGLIASLSFYSKAANLESSPNNGVRIELDDGTLCLEPLSNSAIRIRYSKSDIQLYPEEIVYIEKTSTPQYRIKEDAKSINLCMDGVTVSFDKENETLSFFNAEGRLILKEQEKGRSVELDSLAGMPVFKVRQGFVSPPDEYLYGTGQFQDDYLNIRGLSRRLTQVNTQISIPFILSNQGYGLLWNNYGLTEFNPAENTVALKRHDYRTKTVTVDATGTSGNVSETRNINQFTGELNISSAGKYALMLDVGQAMARKHHLVVGGDTVISVDNVWLPPTTSAIVELREGIHEVVVEGERNDKPVLYWKPLTDETVLCSPVAEALDYTVFVGTPEDIIANYRQVTGQVPMPPKWAFGYVHCRERYNTQKELLENARTFRDKKIPIDVIIQDWQYWGKYGWNAMRFDEDRYPDPMEMVDSLHKMNMRMMISVWSRVEKGSQLGSQFEEKGYFIPNTEWVDFFNPDAAAFYWKNFAGNLLSYKIDGWWLDATEPENDDLQNRKILNGNLPGEFLRNAYPLYVNRTVYEGLRKDDPMKRRAFILTRSAFTGMQRYGTVTWSGDVGCDWDALRRQIVGGLGQMCAGAPWWTYDAGGFFRPGDQYTNKDYHELFVRWFQAATFFPILRVHGYMSNTEPWRYGEQVESIVSKYLDLRYRMLPYVYSEVSRVSSEGSTLMRPLVFDFYDDPVALQQKYQFMFGPSILVSPVTDPGVKQWSVYLPVYRAGWIDFWSGKKQEGGTFVNAPVDLNTIPLFVKAGSIIPLDHPKQYVFEKTGEPQEIRIYPGADAEFTLYEDEGDYYHYEEGLFSTIDLKWDDTKSTLTIGKRKGKFPGMEQTKIFNVVLVKPGIEGEGDSVEKEKKIVYSGKQKRIRFK